MNRLIEHNRVQNYIHTLYGNVTYDRGDIKKLVRKYGLFNKWYCSN